MIPIKIYGHKQVINLKYIINAKYIYNRTDRSNVLVIFLLFSINNFVIFFSHSNIGRLESMNE